MPSDSNKLIVLDFDGTIDDGTDLPSIHLEVQAVLDHAVSLGWRWVINSDRSREDLLRVLRELRCDSRPVAIIAHRRTIDFIDEQRDYQPHISWNKKCEAAYQVLDLRIAPYVEKWKKQVRETFHVRLDLSNSSEIAFVVDPKEVQTLRAQLLNWLKDFQDAEVSCNHESCFIIHRIFCKGKATREVARFLRIERTHIGAIGDALNDLPMLLEDTSGRAGCPANACLEIRRYMHSRNGGLVAKLDGAFGTVEIINTWLCTPPITIQTIDRTADREDHNV